MVFSAVILAWFRAQRSRNRGSISGIGNTFVSFSKGPVLLWDSTHPVSYLKGGVAYFFGVTVARASNAEVTDAWSHTSTFRYAFMAWWLSRHTANCACKFVTGSGVVVVLHRLTGYDCSVSRGRMSPCTISSSDGMTGLQFVIVSNRLLRESKAKVHCRSA